MIARNYGRKRLLIAVTGLLLAPQSLAGAASPEDDLVLVPPGGVKEIDIGLPLEKSEVTSSAPDVAKGTIEGSQLIISAGSTGKARLKIHGVRKRSIRILSYLIQTNQKEHSTNNIEKQSDAVVQYLPFEHSIAVIVDEMPVGVLSSQVSQGIQDGQSGKAPPQANPQTADQAGIVRGHAPKRNRQGVQQAMAPTRLTANDFFEIEVGKAKSATLPWRAKIGRLESNNPSVATVERSDSSVVVRGVTPGRAQISISGENERLSVGIPRSSDHPQLGRTVHFEMSLVVDVVDSNAEEPEPIQTVQAEDVAIPIDLCNVVPSILPLPKGVSRVTIQLDDKNLVEVSVLQEGGVLLRATGNGLGETMVQLSESDPKGDQPRFRQKLLVNVVDCDLTGVWKGKLGALLLQSGQSLVAEFDNGRKLVGDMDGRVIKLSAVYANEDIPNYLPEEVRSQIVGKQVAFVGEFSADVDNLGLSTLTIEGEITYPTWTMQAGFHTSSAPLTLRAAHQPHER